MANAYGTLPETRCSGIWSIQGKPLYVGDPFNPATLQAPSGSASLNATSDGLSFRFGHKNAIPLDVMINPPLMEAIWAPDSRGFAINVSDGGLVGTWESFVFTIGDDGVPILLSVHKTIRKVLAATLRCEPKEIANVGFVIWLAGGKEALMVAEVPPHSSCQNMGSIFGFRIVIDSGHVVERISESLVRRRWAGWLGCRIIRKAN